MTYNKKFNKKRESNKLLVAGMSAIITTTALSTVAEAAVNSQNDSNQVSIQSYSVNSFINGIAPIARSLANNNGLYASVMIAQATLESAYGTSALASYPNYNLFGMKGSYYGNSVLFPTLEDNGKGQYSQINAKFRKYPSYQESLQDYVSLIKNGLSWNPFFYANVWVANTNTYRDATAALTGTYATDTRYAAKLNNLIETYNLTQYDTLNGYQDTSTGNTSQTSTPTANNSNTTYTIVSGDTLSKIAQKYKVSVANLKEWNNLKSDTIYVGQKLTLGKTTTTPSKTTSTTNTPTTTSSIYKVASGDTLSKIAQKYKVSVANLKAWNNLKTDTIYVGQKLNISKITTTPTKTTSTTTTPTTTTSKTYKVVSGDTLSKIAQKYKVSVANLKAWNNLKSDNIYIGQKLNISKTTVTPAKTTSTTKTTQKASTTTTSKTYKVVSGDTLSKIAQKYKISIANLKAWNNLKSDNIYIGQKLNISKTTVTPAKTTSTTKTTQKASTTTTSKTYKVVSGDTLSKIAQKYKISIANLKAWNNLKSDNIYIGQKLNISKTTVTPAKTTSTTKTTQKASTTTTSKTYKVVSGDTLSKIAKKYKISVANLKTWNNLKSDRIYVGQKLNVSKAIITKTSNSSVKTTATSISKSPSDLTTYTVKTGDSLSVIGKVYNVSINNLKAWNNLKTDTIYVGQKIKIQKPQKNTNNVTISNTKSTSSKKYTVQSGDSLSVIGKIYGVSINNLKVWNHLKSDLIYVGQQLIVKK
ncbi:LysM peptidoglycan-binding domain-containing protein [Rummeliibacillus sp. JY-2-4R]